MTASASPTATVVPSQARERILSTAYDLFARRGIRAVGVDEVVATSGVAKATLYKHFRSKDDLVLAFLQRREQLWTIDFVEAQSAARASDPEGQLMAIFDVFHDWFQQPPADFEGCPFINVLLEMGATHPLGQASAQHLANIRAIVARRATEAKLTDAKQFAASWHILMKGSIVAAAEGDTQAAQRAKELARVLIDQHRPRSPDIETGRPARKSGKR